MRGDLSLLLTFQVIFLIFLGPKSVFWLCSLMLMSFCYFSLYVFFCTLGIDYHLGFPSHFFLSISSFFPFACQEHPGHLGSCPLNLTKLQIQFRFCHSLAPCLVARQGLCLGSPLSGTAMVTAVAPSASSLYPFKTHTQKK